MTNPPTRLQGHLQFKDYIRGRFDVPNQKDLKSALEFFAGDTITLEVQVFDKCKDPVPLEGWDITFTVKAEEWDDEILYQVNSVDDPKFAFFHNAAKGVIHVIIPPSVSRILDVGQYIFDVQVKLAPAEEGDEPTVKTVLRSWFIIKRDVSGYVDPTP